MTGTQATAPSSLWRTTGLLVLLVTATGCYPNFYEVDEGRFYRSGQMDSPLLEEYLVDFGIRTVINLRGASPDEYWYRSEVETCRRLGVEHHDISMSSRRIPHRDNLRRLLELYETAELPIMVHCHGGSDRSGLASALWAIEHMGRSKRRARKMLGPRFFHFSRWTPSQKYFLEIYEGEDWAFEVYDPCVQVYEYYPRDRYCGSPEEPGQEPLR